ncbi:MAG: GFA family protein [Pseudomonadales bacterium]|nr:GFA family protein [Pseudomonadales bacterium]MDP7597213.1 GFA family protein [Pseudomonadales bacterium]HJN51913.1 GFA family protein [Pseudomonadales bacterium]
MSDTNLTGGCLCGAIRFKVTASPLHSTVCYCTSCRRAFGAQSVAWVTVSLSSFSFTGTHPSTFTSSPGVSRTFCGTCGTSLTYSREGRVDDIDIATATLDNPESCPPEGIVFPSNKVAWDICIDKPILHDEG